MTQQPLFIFLKSRNVMAMMKGGNGVGKREALAVLALALLIYLLLNALGLRGSMVYLLPSACWGLLALASLRACGWDRVRSWFSSQVSMAAASVAMGYVMILLYVGVLSGFGRSPYSFAPPALALNAIMVATTLLGMEFSRACVARGLGGRRPFLALSSVALLYSFLGISVSRFTGLADPLALTKFLGAVLLPAVAESLLATYLALVGGPLVSLSYRAPLAAFWWFSPILPHLPWGIEALLGVMVPSIGFFAINLYVHPMALRRLGLSDEPRGFGRPRESARGLIALSIACVLLVWASTGLLGVQPTAILSGSMRPSMDVGDMAIVRQVSADSIGVGDVIQFWRDGEMIVHRVVEVYRGGNGGLFVTKGDANNEPDPLPVRPEQVRGKVILTLPKVGWAAIAVKEFAARAWSFASAYPLPTALAAFGFCAIYALRGRSSRRWRAPGFKGARGGRRLALPLSLLLVATAASGLAYSHWSETLFIEGIVNTGRWKLVTRTQGFWSTHPEYAGEVWLSIPAEERVIGSKNMGDGLNDVEEMLGAFWSDIPKKSDGESRTLLDRARMQLVQQLVAAMLNVQAFGDDVWGSGAALIAAGKEAFVGEDRDEILRIAGELDAFNSSGDAEPLPPGVDPGPADPRGARERADVAFWDTLP